MRRPALIVSTVLLLLTFATGCWNRRELNTLAIQLGTGIDKIGDQYQIAVQVVDPSEVAAAKSAATVRSPVVMYKATASSLFEAYRTLTVSSPRKIYGSHIRVLIIGESLARTGIDKVLDLLSRDPELRTDYYIMIARGTSAENVLKILTPLEKIPANKLFASLDTSSKAWAPTTAFTLDQLISQMVVEGQHPVLTGVVIKGDPKPGESQANVKQIEPSAYLKLSGLAVFKGARLVGWLNRDESKGYNILMDNIKSTAANLTCPDGGTIVLEILRSKTKVKGEVANDEPAIHVQMKSEANIAEVNCKIDLSDPMTIHNLEIQAAQKSIELMENSVKVMQTRYNSDIFGFGQVIYRSNPKYWSKKSGDWDSLFRQLQVKYKAEFLIRRTGTTGNSFVQDIKG